MLFLVDPSSPEMFTRRDSLQVAEAAEEGHCVWYGECYKDSTYNHVKNCPYDGPAKELDMRGQEIFAKNCPHMLTSNGVPKTCCDTKQLTTFDQNIRMASSILQRCPSCLSNFVKHICEYTCSPRQSSFVKVTQLGTSPESEFRFLPHRQRCCVSDNNAGALIYLSLDRSLQMSRTSTESRCTSPPGT